MFLHVPSAKLQQLHNQKYIKSIRQRAYYLIDTYMYIHVPVTTTDPALISCTEVSG